MAVSDQTSMDHRTDNQICRMAFVTIISACLTVLSFAKSAAAQPGMPQPSSPLYGARQVTATNGLPPALKDVGIDQHLNQQLPLDLSFRDETGQTVQLNQYFDKRPVILSLVYYNCPMLCTQVLKGMVSSLRVISFNPRETPALVATKKSNYVNSLPAAKRSGAISGWHFLTGDETNIRRLTEAVGFRYHWDDATKQFAHASGIMVLTPEGKLAQYYYGIEYSAKDLRLGLVEASANKIGTTVDQLLLYCYHY